MTPLRWALLAAILFLVWAYFFLDTIHSEPFAPNNWPPCRIVITDGRAVAIDWTCAELWAVEGSPGADDTGLARMLIARRDRLVGR